MFLRVLTQSCVIAVATVVAATALNATAMAGSSGVGAPAPAGGELGVPADSAQSVLRGFYLAVLTNEVGQALPGATLCVRFKASGAWSSTGSETFNGTYLLSGKQLFASAVWLPSPAVYMSVQGTVDAERGSGVYIVSGINGYVSGGGTFTMTRKQSSSCT